jgi:hypothetical protein
VLERIALLARVERAELEVEGVGTAVSSLTGGQQRCATSNVGAWQATVRAIADHGRYAP